MKENPPNIEVTSLEFAPHADSFLGSPFWNAILHRKSEAGIEWRSSGIFWWIDALFHIAAFFWIRAYRRKKRDLY